MEKAKKTIPRNKKRKRLPTIPTTFHEFRELEMEDLTQREQEGLYRVESLTGLRRIVYPKKAVQAPHGIALGCEYQARFSKCGTVEWVNQDDLLGGELESECKQLDIKWTKHAFGQALLNLQGHHLKGPKKTLLHGKFSVYYPLERRCVERMCSGVIFPE